MKANSENEIELSVIVPVYNVKNTLCKAVDSIIDQNFDKLEIILIDDGSTDGSQNICDDYEKKYGFISVIHKVNGGLSSARNAGIGQAEGKYITFIDSDDYYINLFFGIAIEELVKSKGDIFVFGLRKGTIKKNKDFILEDYAYFSDEDAIKKLFCEESVDFYAWNKIYKRSLFQDIRYPEGHLYEDIIPTYTLFKKADKIIFSNILGIFYYSNSDSIVNQEFNIAQYDNVLQRVKLYNYIKKDYPSLESLGLGKLTDGFLSTGFKVSGTNSKNRNVHLKALRSDIRSYFWAIFSCRNLSISKKIGLLMLLTNSRLYKKIYSWVLGK